LIAAVGQVSILSHDTTNWLLRKNAHASRNDFCDRHPGVYGDFFAGRRDPCSYAERETRAVSKRRENRRQFGSAVVARRCQSAGSWLSRARRVAFLRSCGTLPRNGGWKLPLPKRNGGPTTVGPPIMAEARAGSTAQSQQPWSLQLGWQQQQLSIGQQIVTGTSLHTTRGMHLVTVYGTCLTTTRGFSIVFS